MTDEQLERRCREIFQSTPIVFRARRNVPLDSMIQNRIQHLGIKIPVVLIKSQLYLVGSQRVNLSIKRDQLVARTGAGYERFDDFVQNNHICFQKQLVLAMMKSGDPLEAVVNQII